jgi:hypothetical protein
VLRPVGVHGRLPVDLDPALGQQPQVEKFEDRNGDVLQSPITDERLDVGPDVVQIVRPRRGLERVAHRIEPLGHERSDCPGVETRCVTTTPSNCPACGDSGETALGVASEVAAPSAAPMRRSETAGT